MSPFKKFNIQWAWFVNKRGFGRGLLIASIILIFAFAGMIVFVLGFLYNEEGERIISNNSIQIIGGILALVFFYLYYIICTYTSSSKNFKIAIDKAKKFAAENPHLILTETGSFTREIIEAEKTKDPTKLNKRIQNFRELYSVKEKLQVLEEKKEEIEKGIPLKEVKAEIEARKEKIKELESQLWSD